MAIRTLQGYSIPRCVEAMAHYPAEVGIVRVPDRYVGCWLWAVSADEIVSRPVPMPVRVGALLWWKP